MTQAGNTSATSAIATQAATGTAIDPARRQLLQGALLVAACTAQQALAQENSATREALELEEVLAEGRPGTVQVDVYKLV